MFGWFTTRKGRLTLKININDPRESKPLAWSSSVKYTQVHPWCQLMKRQQFSSVQLLSHVRLFATSWIAAHQSSLSITNSQSSLRLKCIESVMPSSHLILCRPLLLLPPIPPSIRVFSKESTLRMRWPKYWSFSFSIIPFKEIPRLISFRMDSPKVFFFNFILFLNFT